MYGKHSYYWKVKWPGLSSQPLSGAYSRVKVTTMHLFWYWNWDVLIKQKILEALGRVLGNQLCVRKWNDSQSLEREGIPDSWQSPRLADLRTQLSVLHDHFPLCAEFVCVSWEEMLHSAFVLLATLRTICTSIPDREKTMRSLLLKYILSFHKLFHQCVQKHGVGGTDIFLSSPFPLASHIHTHTPPFCVVPDGLYLAVGCVLYANHYSNIALEFYSTLSTEIEKT